MRAVVEPKVSLLDPTKNQALQYLLRTTIYDHFCAGATEQEVKQTVRNMKDWGFKGVILGYARDVVLNQDDSQSRDASAQASRDAANAKMVEEWKEGNLKTLSMIGEGDYLAVKYVVSILRLRQ